MNANERVIQSQLVEILIPKSSSNTKFTFPDLANLRNVNLMGLEAYLVTYLPKSIISQRAVVSLALFKSSYITLESYNGVQFIKQMPLIDLHKILLNSTTNPTRISNLIFAGQKVNYPVSYVEVADTTLISAAQDEVFLFSASFYNRVQKVLDMEFSNLNRK